MKASFIFSIQARHLSLNKETKFKMKDFTVEILHRDNEPENALRIQIFRENLKVELLPSKGLSIGEVFVMDIPVLTDPDKLNLISREILVNHKEIDGFTFLKTFMGGIEFYGMTNWGMPRFDQSSGELHLLHGETSNIPVDEVTGVLYHDRLEMSGKFIFRKFDFISGNPWYNSGSPLYEITNTIVIPKGGTSIKTIVKVKNITNEIQEPDWGYHITFRPENGSRLVVPSRSVEERVGNKVPDDFETWRPAKNSQIRTETGIIHKDLKLYMEKNKTVNKSLMVYPSGRGISVIFPPSPYFQTWFCNGGANSTEFSYAETGDAVFKKNWDAQGIEIGSSALDHNGKIDSNVEYNKYLAPDESFENEVEIELLTEEQTALLYKDIINYNKFRT